MNMVKQFRLLHNAANKLYFVGRRQTIHHSSLLRDFVEKPRWLEKRKLKQAAMQRNDGVPVYLKKGLPDKILFNITFFAVMGGFCYSLFTIFKLARKFK